MQLRNIFKLFGPVFVVLVDKSTVGLSTESGEPFHGEFFLVMVLSQETMFYGKTLASAVDNFSL